MDLIKDFKNNYLLYIVYTIILWLELLRDVIKHKELPENQL